MRPSSLLTRFRSALRLLQLCEDGTALDVQGYNRLKGGLFSPSSQGFFHRDRIPAYEFYAQHVGSISPSVEGTV